MLPLSKSHRHQHKRKRYLNIITNEQTMRQTNAHLIYISGSFCIFFQIKVVYNASEIQTFTFRREATITRSYYSQSTSTIQDSTAHDFISQHQSIFEIL